MARENSFLTKVLEKARSDVKRIVLPEGNDKRILKAVRIATESKIAQITILGDEEKTRPSLENLGADTSQIEIINPHKSEKVEQYAQTFYDLRKDKGVTLKEAVEVVKDPIYFGTMMVKVGQADGLVAGAIYSTAEAVRPALQIIKPASGINIVSSAFFICLKKKAYIFSDCAIVRNPDAQQLADIALTTASTAIQFGIKPCIAMLSYSTKGSAGGEGARKVAEATEIARKKVAAKFGDRVVIDGELQFDAAFVPEIAKRKSPDSPVKGQAQVFIFPDLGAANIAYKAVQRLGGADAYGPILQGLARPVGDLSRGCSSDDIVATIAITVVQAQGLD